MTVPLPGRLITLEGGEGAGKSTQTRLLQQKLASLGHETVITREPGGTPGAEEIRTLLVTGEPGRWTAETETLLNYAARADHLAKVIRPTLERGTWVISDRFIDSTRVYQGHAGGADAGLIDALEAAIIGPTRPDLTLMLDLPPETGLQRTKERGGAGEDRFERKALAFHTRLRDGFLAIAEREPQRCVVVDATRTADDVAQVIWAHVQERLLSDGQRSAL